MVFLNSVSNYAYDMFKTTMHKNDVFHSRFLQYVSPDSQETADLVTFTEEILNGKLHFLCSVIGSVVTVIS